MSCTDKKNKYDIDNIPASMMTKDGCNLNIDSIALIGRMLSTQDDCFAEEIEAMQVRITTNLAELMTDFTKNIFVKLDKIQEDIQEIKTDIQEIKTDVVNLYKEINTLKKRVNVMEKQIRILEDTVEKHESNR